MIKFPTEYGMGELRGNQMATRECYVTMMEMDDHLQAMNIEKHRTMMEPIKKLEEILLDDSKLDRTTKLEPSLVPRSIKHSRPFLEVIRMYFLGATKTC